MKIVKKLLVLLLMFFCSLSIFGMTYDGVAEGYNGKISVKVDLEKTGQIIDIKIGENKETKGIGDIAVKNIPQLIIKNQSLNIDLVAGATVTSEAVVEAVAKALKSAGKDLNKYNYIEKNNHNEKNITKSAVKILPKKKPVEKTMIIKDAKGREVEIGLPISTYAISTMDVIDYIVPLKGKEAFNMLVGAGQDGGHGLNKYAKLYTPIVGDYMEHTAQISEHNAPFDLESILAMQPDVLIVNSAMSAHKYALEIEEQLSQAGIKIIFIDVPGKKIEKSVQQAMKILGQVFNEEKKADEVINFIDKQFNLVISKKLKEKDKKPTVYYEKSGYSQVFGPTATSKSGWGSVIDIAGGKNIADELLINTVAGKGAGNKLDPEYVLEANPDFIIVSGINDGWLSSVSKKGDHKFDIVNRNAWNNLKAIKNKNFYEFAHSTNRSIYVFYPTLKIATILYPEEFKGVNPEKILQEFFDKFMIVDSDISTWHYDLKEYK